MITTQIEPGLIKVFRLTVAVTGALGLLSACGELGDPPQRLTSMTIFALVYAGVLLVYLSWRWLRRRVGRWYLPLALIFASISPILATAATIAGRVQDGITGDLARPESGGLLMWLLVPLLLVSSQYSMRVMFVFCFGTAALEIAAGAVLAANDGPSMDTVTEEAFIRVLLFVIVGYVIVRLSKEQRTQRRALAEKNAQLSHYATTLEQLAVSRERNRMARDLHDTLAHTLTAVSVQLQALEVLQESDPAAARLMLRQIQDITRTGVQEARRALQALRASPLEDLGLVLAIRQLAESGAARAGLALKLDLPEQIDHARPGVEQHLYRIAEEALTNVVRHANARHLTVRLRQRSAQTRLTISDDGAGFDPDAASANGHYGLVGMRERALLCGGKLTITSQPGKGTTVEAVIEDGDS